MRSALTRRAFLAFGAVGLGAVGGLAMIAGAAPGREQPGHQRVTLADLTLLVAADPWRLSLLGPDGQTLWEEAPDQTIGYRTASGAVHRARRLATFNVVNAEVVQIAAETDPPGGVISVEVRAIAPGALRISLTP